MSIAAYDYRLLVSEILEISCKPLVEHIKTKSLLIMLEMSGGFVAKLCYVQKVAHNRLTVFL